MAIHRTGQADAERRRREVGFAALRVNGRLRDECLNETLFTSLAHARFVLAAWRHDYDTVMPHSKLGAPWRHSAQLNGQRGWGHAPSHVANPSNNHHEGTRIYL